MKMKNAYRCLMMAAVLLLTLAPLQPARAMTVGLSGIVNSADFNPFGIDVELGTGTVATGFVIFDETLIPVNGTLGYLQDPTLQFDFHVGSFAFSSATDFFMDLTLGFVDSTFRSLALLGGEGSLGYGLDLAWDGPAAVSSFFIIQPDSLQTLVTGEIAPVPVPAPLLLLGTGLASLVGIRWKLRRG
jgi:hypothetical protein